MTVRERLIELLKDGGVRDFPYVNALADHLLANGVIVPPCKVGEKVYSVSKTAVKGHWVNNRYIVDEWDMWKVCYLPFSLTLWENGKLGKDYFLTREDAEKALEERSDKS